MLIVSKPSAALSALPKEAGEVQYLETSDCQLSMVLALSDPTSSVTVSRAVLDTDYKVRTTENNRAVRDVVPLGRWCRYKTQLVVAG